MCTLSAVLSADGEALRVVMNRDERRLRMAAMPPAIFEHQGVRAVWPTDQQAGGTWIAANDAGLVLAVMNANPGRTPAARRPDAPSRGLIIPALISAHSLAEVEARFADLADGGAWSGPFTLVAITRDGARSFTPGVRPIAGGHLWSSSSLGDDWVVEPRRALFDQLLAASVDGWTAQERLHQHAWPDRRHLSVVMSRPDACTVSRTEVVVRPGRVEMRYCALIDGWPAGVATTTVSLPGRGVAAAA